MGHVKLPVVPSGPTGYLTLIEKNMKRPLAIGALLAAILIIALGTWLKRGLSIDSCLDRGGRWNYELSVCEGASE